MPKRINLRRAVSRTPPPAWWTDLLRELAESERELGEAAIEYEQAEALLRMREARAKPLREAIKRLTAEGSNGA